MVPLFSCMCVGEPCLARLSRLVLNCMLGGFNEGGRGIESVILGRLEELRG